MAASHSADCVLRCMTIDISPGYGTNSGFVSVVSADREYYAEAFEVVPKHWLRFDDTMVSRGGLSSL